MSCIAYQLRMTNTPPWVWVILIHSHSFSCIIITHTVSCMSHNVYQPRMTTTPSLNMSDSQSFSCILIQYHACRTMYVSIEWHTPSLNMSDSQSSSVILMHSHHIHVHSWWDSVLHSQSFSCILITDMFVRGEIVTHSHGCRLVYIRLEWPPHLPEHEWFSHILSHSHAFSSQTCSFMMR